MGYIADSIRQSQAGDMVIALEPGVDTKSVAEFGVKLAELEMKQAGERMKSVALELKLSFGDLKSHSWSVEYEREQLALAREAYNDYQQASLAKQKAMDTFNASE